MPDAPTRSPAFAGGRPGTGIPLILPARRCRRATAILAGAARRGPRRGPLRVDGSASTAPHRPCDDLGSTNGVLVDGAPIDRPTPVDSASVLVRGTSTLRLRRPPPHGLAAIAGGDGREIRPTSRPRSAPEQVVEVACPAAPPERHRARVPWLAPSCPSPSGSDLALFLGPQLLVFALLGPVMLLASALGDRWGAGRAARRDTATHAATVSRAREQLAAALADERSRLDRAHPDPQAVLATVERRMPGLWVGDDRLVVRLGIGETPTRVAWVEDGTRSHPWAAGTAGHRLAPGGRVPRRRGSRRR